jgi:hypothetical protein
MAAPEAAIGEQSLKRRGIKVGGAMLLLLVAAGCQAGGNVNAKELAKEDAVAGTVADIVVEIGGREFPARLEDTEAARFFAGRLPVSLAMEDLNAREKYNLFPVAFPGGGTLAPSTIHAGEILCWSSNTVVLFYRTFANSYSGYDRIGAIQDTTGLAQALGKGAVTVTFRKGSMP